ncbi:MAG: hypothetical protein ACREBJ_07915 [Nitrosotalea sp.]
MFGRKKQDQSSDFDFYSNENLGRALEKLQWEYTGRLSTEICIKIPALLLAAMREIRQFESGDYFYTLDAFDGIIRSSPKIKAPVENILEKIMYFVDGVGVTLGEIQDRLKKKEEVIKQ